MTPASPAAADLPTGAPGTLLKDLARLLTTKAGRKLGSDERRRGQM